MKSDRECKKEFYTFRISVTFRYAWRFCVNVESKPVSVGVLAFLFGACAVKLKALQPRVRPLEARVAVTVAPSWRTGKSTAAERGYDYRWQKYRRIFLRANPLCKMCLDEGKVTPATVVDHINPHRGDMALFWDASNHQALCMHHHSGAKQRIDNQQ